ncbi:hypothetical protein DRO57_01065 [Candidatus Bathyarchaeota archaeon]|nr:MAG: hypothetical protein DRO57_01065 [Candidatus Bathyarchaeota archaeon]
MKFLIEELWSLDVGVGPAEHGVYKFGYLWLSPTFRNQVWKVDPATGKVLQVFSMPGKVWGAAWVDRDAVYSASDDGSVRRFTHDGEVVWSVNPGLGGFIAEAIVEAWNRYLAVQFPNGLAVLRKSDGGVVWSIEWSPIVNSGQEPTFTLDTGLLWVCKPTAEDNLEAYDLHGRRLHRFTLPSPPTTYACPQVWNNFMAVVCRDDVVVLDHVEGRVIWSRRFKPVEYGGKEFAALEGGPRVITPDGRLIVWTTDGVFHCFGMETGTALWRLDMVELGYASRDCNDPWGYAGGAAADGVLVILGRNNLPEGSGSPFEFRKNRLFLINYFDGSIAAVSKPKYQMACCCKPVVAGGRVVIGGWYEDSENRRYENRYYCWRLGPLENRRVRDVDYEWLGGYHHGGYSVGTILGI